MTPSPLLKMSHCFLKWLLFVHEHSKGLLSPKFKQTTLTQPCSPFKAPWGPFFITAKSVTEFNFFLSALLCATEKAILKVINVFFLC